MDELLGLGGDDYDYAAPEEGYAPPPRERLRAGVNAVRAGNAFSAAGDEKRQTDELLGLMDEEEELWEGVARYPCPLHHHHHHPSATRPTTRSMSACVCSLVWWCQRASTAGGGRSDGESYRERRPQRILSVDSRSDSLHGDGGGNPCADGPLCAPLQAAPIPRG